MTLEEYIEQVLDDPGVGRRLARLGLRGGRATCATLAVLHGAKCTVGDVQQLVEEIDGIEEPADVFWAICDRVGRSVVEAQDTVA